jgi:hypothetical protein
LTVANETEPREPELPSEEEEQMLEELREDSESEDGE